MELITSILGSGGIIFVVGVAVFLFTYKYSVGIFDWFERQTIGTRTFILEKCEILMMEIKEDHITYGLLGLSLGLGGLFTVLLGFGVNWVFGLIVGGIVTFISFKI